MNTSENTPVMWNRLDRERAELALDNLERLPTLMALSGQRMLGGDFHLPTFEAMIGSYRRKVLMMLLKTGQISSDLRAAKAIDSSERVHKCFNQVRFHQQESANFRELLRIQAQDKLDKALESSADTELNSLESAYYQDRRDELWPFESSTADFGAGYRGWLRWKFENGKLGQAEYAAEKERLG